MSGVHHRMAHPTTVTSMEADDPPQESTRVLEVVLPQREVHREEGWVRVQRVVRFLCQERLLGVSKMGQLRIV